MKLAKALKEKNKKVKLIKTLSDRIATNNSYVKGTHPTYNVDELMRKYDAAIEDLVKFKAAIVFTNAPIIEKIIRMSELKSKIRNLEYISTTEGIQTVHRREGIVPPEYVAVINEGVKDKLIEKIQGEIDDLQEEIDVFNATTELKNYT